MPSAFSRAHTSAHTDVAHRLHLLFPKGCCLDGRIGSGKLRAQRCDLRLQAGDRDRVRVGLLLADCLDLLKLMLEVVHHPLGVDTARPQRVRLVLELAHAHLGLVVRRAQRSDRRLQGSKHSVLALLQTASDRDQRGRRTSLREGCGRIESARLE